MATPTLTTMFREECLQLLGTHRVGRLGVVEGRSPVIFPVNYVLDGDHVVFRTDDGTKLSRGLGSSVCFEVDELDEDAETGWSVVVRGELEEPGLYDAPGREAATHALPVQPWASGSKAHWLRLVPRSITGRRIGKAS